MPQPLRILLAERLDAEAETRLAATATVVRSPANTPEALREHVADCDALVARTHTRVTREVLEASKRLKVVGIAGVGLDNLDLGAAQELGIQVVYTPAAAANAVAELTTLLMLQLLRPTPKLAAAYVRGDYHAARIRPHGHELQTRTVGIIGMGRIGSRVGKICSSGFGSNVLYNDIREVGPFSFDATPVDKSTIYAESDFISIHVPLTDETRGMISTPEFEQMQEHACLVNTSRGAVVDTDALVDALLRRRIGGAALDVTNPEPLPPGHPLFKLENCIVLPHVAARTHMGLRRMFDVVDQVLDALTRLRRRE